MNIRAYRRHRHKQKKYGATTVAAENRSWAYRESAVFPSCPLGHGSCLKDKATAFTAKRYDVVSEDAYLGYDEPRTNIRERARSQHSHTYYKVSVSRSTVWKEWDVCNNSCSAGHSRCYHSSLGAYVYTGVSVDNPIGEVSDFVEKTQIRTRDVPSHTHELPDSVLSFTTWDYDICVMGYCPEGHDGCSVEVAFRPTVGHKYSSQTSGGVEY